ncbi:SulP family inorganic anion transporter [Breznakiella homolactica]|uniref:STAS domain-containing protein n=1 Tax=Breznakiella homolactica TaxID=2798577 RepID=A0A7T8BC50_9SPIR|nr:SulP family inorganic anion transporter [Breznakiella homolactica]QQO09858.1 STAS domain-containing protein [Breznakiella homolactica]
MDSFKFVSPRDFIPRFFELFSKNTGKRYSWSSFGKDCIAGITVGFVALPLAMAFSIAAGGTPAQGLFTSILAGFTATLLGGSNFQISGPSVSFLIITIKILSSHGMGGLFTATFMAGILLILMGLSGLGRFIKYIPYPVTTGFSTGIAVIIFSQQIKDFLGLAMSQSSSGFYEKWSEYFRFFPTMNPAALGIGLGTILVILAVRKFAPRIPGSVIGVVAATAACFLFHLPVETIGSRFGGVPSSFPLPALPSLNWATIRLLFPDAVTIALLAVIESLLSAVVADGMTGERHNSNMELVAQGASNMVSAFFGGIPSTGAIARTATNIKSGAVSPVAGMVHVLILLLFVLFLAPAASLIPLTSLSAVLMVVAWDVGNFGRFFRVIKTSPKSDTIVLLTTFFLTVLVDITFAVEVGVVMAAFLFMRRMIEVAGVKPGTKDMAAGLVHDTPDTDGPIPEHPKDIEIYEITGPFFFGVADILQDTLRGITKTPHAFILRMKDVPAIDSTGIAALESCLAQCRHRKIRLFISEIREQPRRALEKSGFIREIGPDHITETLDDALAAAARTGAA